MQVGYIRRFRMEFDFALNLIEPATLPEGYEWVKWGGGLVDRHAAVKFCSFQREIDSQVFPSLSLAAGCRRLMKDISEHETFLPLATWLIRFRDGAFHCDCATIQGMRKPHLLGSIQNVGVLENHRGLGLGRALVLQSLLGFRRSGLKRVALEVTADNEPAVALYRSVGFRLCRTMFQEVEVHSAPPVESPAVPPPSRRYRPRLAGCH